MFMVEMKEKMNEPYNTLKGTATSMPRPKNIDRDESFYPNPKPRQGEKTLPVRVGGRMKKAKVVFDPSENNIPRKRTSRSLSGCPSNIDIEPPKTYKKPKILATQPAWVEAQKKTQKVLETHKSPPVLEPQQVNDICMICGKADLRKGRRLVTCKDCNYKVHGSCLKINFQNLNLVEEHWRCNNCTTCVVCYETSEAGILATCCICVDAYHLTCHVPKLSQNKNFNKYKWECTKCQNITKNTTVEKHPLGVRNEGYEKKQADSTNEVTTSTDILPKVASRRITDSKTEAKPENLLNKKLDGAKHINKMETQTKKCVSLTDDDIPDVADWSCEKVTEYIKQYFPKEAHIFLEQEIDGSSLLLLKRSDVVSHFPVKLGPAIRIYSLIVKLQTKSNDPRLTWM